MTLSTGLRAHRRLLAATAVLVGASVAGAGVGFGPAGAQVISTTQRAITVIVNIPGQTPSGVTAYRVDGVCRNLLGLATPETTMTLTVAFPPAGGTGTLFFPLQVGSSCFFRLWIDGTGPRAVAGGAVTVGGNLYPVATPTLVNGVAVEVGTVLESVQIPVEAPTTVVFGSVPVPTTTTTTTTTSTTTTVPATTTTTRPVTTTAPPTTASPTTVVVPVAPIVTAPPTTRRVVKTTKPRYRRVCTTRRVKGKNVRTCRLVRIR